MKQGKTEKAVFAKLSKVELAQHEVELAKVDDLMRQFDEIVKLDKSMDEAYKELSRVATRARSQGEALKKDYAKAESQMKDLGIDPNTILPNAMLGRLNNIVKKAEKVKNL